MNRLVCSHANRYVSRKVLQVRIHIHRHRQGRITSSLDRAMTRDALRDRVFGSACIRPAALARLLHHNARSDLTPALLASSIVPGARLLPATLDVGITKTARCCASSVKIWWGLRRSLAANLLGDEPASRILSQQPMFLASHIIWCDSSVSCNARVQSFPCSSPLQRGARWPGPRAIVT